MINFIRGTILKTISETGKFLKLDFSGRNDETIKNKIALQQYGFQSRPQDGAHVLAIENSELCLVLSTDDYRYKISLDAGDICLGSSDSNKIVLKSNGDVIIKNSGKTTIQSSGNIEFGENPKYLLTEDAATIFNAHTHADDNTPVIPLQQMTALQKTTKTRGQ